MENFGFLDSPDHNLFARADAGDEKLFVVFYMGVLRNEGKSIDEGRPIFDDTECVRIIIPGDKNSVIDRPATKADKARFSKQYGMFQAGAKEEEQVSGTRLTEWPFLTRAQVEEFKHIGIHTVEHIAGARDDICARVPGMHALKRHAEVWLGKAKTSAEAAKTSRLLEDQAAQIAALQNAVRDLGERNERLTAERAKG